MEVLPEVVDKRCPARLSYYREHFMIFLPRRVKT